MQTFIYKAKDKSGATQEAQVEAENRDAAAKLILSRGLFPISIEAAKQDSVFGNFGRVSLKDKVFLARQLATMINAGLPISQSLRVIQGQAQKKSVLQMVTQVSSDVEAGGTLSSAFEKFPRIFNQTDIALISSGETGGTLDKALVRLAEQLEKEQSLLRKIRGALIYPVVIIFVVIGVVAYMVLFIMPQMQELYSLFDADLPTFTKVFMSISNATAKFFPLLLVAGVAAASGIRAWIQKPSGRRFWDSLKLKIPGFNKLFMMLYMVRFTRTLSGLLASGVPLLDALDIVSKAVGNTLYSEEIIKAAQEVKSGAPLSKPLKESELFPKLIGEMTFVGEETGEVDSMLANLAVYYDEELETIIRGISSLIEPLMIVFLGGIVALILVAIMLPVYNISTAINT